MLKPTFLFEEVVEFLHEAAISQYGGARGIMDRGLLQSALGRAENRFYYGTPTPDLFDLAASYAFGLSRNHPFFDGNKRTAWASCVLFLQLNSVSVVAPAREREENMVALAQGQLSEAAFAAWLRAAR